MRKRTTLALAVAGSSILAAAAPVPALAGAPDGRFEVKVFLTDVIPDGHLLSVHGADAAVLAGSDVKTSDNWVPSLAAEVYLTKALSLETICCATEHHLIGQGDLAGVTLARHVLAMPAMVSAKLHFDLGPLKPYLGAGPAMILFPHKRPSAAVEALGLTHLGIAAKVGAVIQGGVDIPVGTRGFLLSADVKRYFDHPQAKFSNADGDVLLTTRHRLDPLLVSAGVGYRF